MDLTIARMSTGERAALHVILQRGLASLPRRQRDAHTVELVERLQSAIATTPILSNHAEQALALLAFAPYGLRLAGVEDEVLHDLERRGDICIRIDRLNRFRITFQGWQKLWDSGQAQQMLDAMQA